MDRYSYKRLFKETYLNADHHIVIINEFEDLHQGDMTMTEYYNKFIKLAHYSRAEAIDTPSLFYKFVKGLRQHIVDKIVEHRISSLVDCYAFAQLVEFNIKGKKMLSTPKNTTW